MKENKAESWLLSVMGEGKLFELVTREGFQEATFKWRHEEVKDWASEHLVRAHQEKVRDQQVEGLRKWNCTCRIQVKPKGQYGYYISIKLYSQWMRWQEKEAGESRPDCEEPMANTKTAAVYLKAEVKPFTCIGREEASSDSRLLSWGNNTL